MSKNKLLEEEKNIPTHVVAVFAIVQKRNKYLISKRSKDDPQAGGQWSFSGGKVEFEKGLRIIEKTLQKEIMEEVGIEIETNVKYLMSEGFRRVNGHHVVGLTFLCRWKRGVAKPLEGQEEIMWLTLRELNNLDAPDYIKEKINLLVN